MRTVRACVSVAAFFAVASLALAAPINQVDYFTLTGTGLITFDDVAGGAAPGTNYDAIFESGEADLAERFVGQTLSYSGDFDVLSGLPGGPLALQIGAPGENLSVYDSFGTHILTGLGPKGFPDYEAIGEGSFAVLFDFDQSEFGFQLVGGNAGTATLDFFQRDGSLIDTIVLPGLGSAYYGFSRDGGIKDIAGVSVYNNDSAGIGVDNILHDVPGVTGEVPEPATLVLVGLSGLVGYGWRRRRRVVSA